MRIIIEMSEDYYADLKENERIYDISYNLTGEYKLENIVLNGIIIPEDSDNLIDTSYTKKDNK